MTSKENKIKILSELWMDYREDESFAEFFEYNDIGLPLSHFIYTEIVLPTPKSDLYILETFDLLLTSLGLEDSDKGYESFEELLTEVSQ